jgi:hypothetical protein
VSESCDANNMLKYLIDACDHFDLSFCVSDDPLRQGKPVSVSPQWLSQDVEDKWLHRPQWCPQMLNGRQFRARMVWTDGSYDDRRKRAAFGVYFSEGHAFNHCDRVCGKQTVALAELQAVEWALENVPSDEALLFVIDRKSVIDLCRQNGRRFLSASGANWVIWQRYSGSGI